MKISVEIIVNIITLKNEKKKITNNQTMTRATKIHSTRKKSSKTTPKIKIKYILNAQQYLYKISRGYHLEVKEYQQIVWLLKYRCYDFFGFSFLQLVTSVRKP